MYINRFYVGAGGILEGGRGADAARWDVSAAGRGARGGRRGFFGKGGEGMSVDGGVSACTTLAQAGSGAEALMVGGPRTQHPQGGRIDGWPRDDFAIFRVRRWWPWKCRGTGAWEGA